MDSSRFESVFCLSEINKLSNINFEGKRPPSDLGIFNISQLIAHCLKEISICVARFARFHIIRDLRIDKPKEKCFSFTVFCKN